MGNQLIQGSSITLLRSGQFLVLYIDLYIFVSRENNEARVEIPPAWLQDCICTKRPEKREKKYIYKDMSQKLCIGSEAKKRDTKEAKRVDHGPRKDLYSYTVSSLWGEKKSYPRVYAELKRSFSASKTYRVLRTSRIPQSPEETVKPCATPPLHHTQTRTPLPLPTYHFCHAALLTAVGVAPKVDGDRDWCGWLPRFPVDSVFASFLFDFS